MNTQSIYKAFIAEAERERGSTMEPTYFEGYSRNRTQRVWDLYAESRKAALVHTPTRPSTKAIDPPNHPSRNPRTDMERGVTLMDQSEDRPARFVVAGREREGRTEYQVLDTHHWGNPQFTWTFVTAGSAVAWAVELESRL